MFRYMAKENLHSNYKFSVEQIVQIWNWQNLPFETICVRKEEIKIHLLFPASLTKLTRQRIYEKK